MAAEQEELTRGQELYIRHIHLFGNVVPLALKATIQKLVEHRGQSLSTLLTQKETHIQTFYTRLYKELFEDNGVITDDQIYYLGITHLCDIVFILAEQPTVDYIQCILDQSRDLEKDAKTACLDYNTFYFKYNALVKSLPELFKDTEVDFECKRLMRSLDESKAIQVRNEVYEKLKLTENFEEHIKIVSECVSRSISMAETEIGVAGGQIQDIDEEDVEFVQQLSDTFIRSGEPGVLVCELNKNDCHAVWSKNDKPVEETNTVYSLATRGRHCLVFSKGRPEESGTYKCTFKDLSTSCCLIVSEREVVIDIPLHTSFDGDIREYMKVELSCTINLSGKTPRWFHNNQEIIGNNTRITLMSKETEHTAIIHNAQLDDSGEYMIVFDGATSKKSITVTGHVDQTIKLQIKQKLFKNWIIGILGLKNLKLGLESPASHAVKTHYERIISALPKPLLDKKCSECNANNLLPLHNKMQCQRRKCLCSVSPHTRRQCPSNGLCSEMYDLIARDHRFEDPAMRNTKVELWRTDAWSVAACYISSTEYIHTTEYKYKESSDKFDCAELLSLFINNKTYLENTSFGVFDMAKRHRNEIQHSPNFEISDQQLLEYLKDTVLEVFGSSTEAKRSLESLKELQHTDIDICTKEEQEKVKQDVRDASLHEAVNKLHTAMIQKYEEFRQMEKQIKSDSQSTKEKVCETHDDTESSWYCITHGKLICLSCKENEHRACYGLLKLAYKEQIELEGTACSLCLLPGGECLVLLKRGVGIYFEIILCKLDKTYSPVSYCTKVSMIGMGMKDRQIEMCYIVTTGLFVRMDLN